MSANLDIVDTYRTHTPPVAMRSHTKVEVNLDMLRALVLNEVGGEVDNADVVVVDEGALHQRSVELLM
jgi:hypothetical protein